jgi:hypothetical protein
VTPERDAVTRAREAVAGAHSLTCPRNDGRTTLCSCGGPTRPIAHLDAYAAAIRAALLAEVVAVVEGMDKFGPAERFDGVAMEQDNLATWINRYDALDRIRALTEAK